MAEDKPEILTETEEIQIKRSGSSDTLRIPAHWRRTFHWLAGSPIFEAHIERDAQGQVSLVFRRVAQNPTRSQEEVNDRR